MDPSELEVLPAAMGAGTSRVFARRHILKYKHPAIHEPDDFLASLRSAFGPPPPGDPVGYVLWHRSTGTHFTAYLHQTWGCYGGGLKFKEAPDVARIAAAYEVEEARRAAIEAASIDIIASPIADLAGSASSFNEHTREAERARITSAPGFFEFLTHFEELLERFPPDDRRVIIAQGLDGPTSGALSLLARGIENGKYFERQVSIDEAYQAISAKLDGRPSEIGAVLYGWWALRAKASKPTEPMATLLLHAWRGHFDEVREPETTAPAEAAGYQESAQARHEDHERAQRWMRFARLGLLLPLTSSDAGRLAAAAHGVAVQSTEYKKLDKLRRTLGPL